MGRKRADVWSQYDIIENEGGYKVRRVRCKHCRYEFTAHAIRMKEHLRDCRQYMDVRMLVGC